MNSDPLTVGLLYTNFHSKDFTSVRNGLFATKKGGYSPIPPKKVCKHIVVKLVTGTNEDAFSK